LKQPASLDVKNGMNNKIKQKGLLPDELVRNPAADMPWKKSETDKMLDLYFQGAPPSRIAVALKRTPKSIKRRIEEFRTNERDRALKYEPRRRLCRSGSRITENELFFIQSFQKRKLPTATLAKILQRKEKEFASHKEAKKNHIEWSKVGSGVDLCLAYRYLYYVKNMPLISDKAYDDIEAEELEFGVCSDVLRVPGSDKEGDYPPHIRALALYLALKHFKRKEE
jgi:hypothetical protein